MLGLIDAHCHLKFNDQNEEAMFIDHFQHEIISCYVSMLYQKDFNQIWNRDYFKLNAGIHPYLIEETDISLDFLQELINQHQICGIGEIGLDYRYPNQERQKKVLLDQLALAQAYNLPVIFHCVNAYYDLYKLLKQNFPKIRGYLHAFTGNIEIYHLFKSFDLFFSLSKRLENHAKHLIILKEIISDGRFIFETDYETSDNQGLTDLIKKYHQETDFFKRMLDLELSENSKLLEKQYYNLQRIYSRI